MTFISRNKRQFAYFSAQLGQRDWQGKDVLDFGGNIGNILQDRNSTIDEERYWCIDVDKEAVEMGRCAYPKSHWLSYNRYCFFFNPHGVPHLPLPEVGQAFDYIVAYSVFTNTPRTDMIDLVDALQGLLKHDGVLAFTFLDPHYRPWPKAFHGTNLQRRIKRDRGPDRAIDIRALTNKAKCANWCILVNGDDLYIDNEDLKTYPPDQQRSCLVFYTARYMKTLYPHAAIRSPVNKERQHCCIIRPASPKGSVHERGKN